MCWSFFINTVSFFSAGGHDIQACSLWGQKETQKQIQNQKYPEGHTQCNNIQCTAISSCLMFNIPPWSVPVCLPVFTVGAMAPHHNRAHANGPVWQQCSAVLEHSGSTLGQHQMPTADEDARWTRAAGGDPGAPVCWRQYIVWLVKQTHSRKTVITSAQWTENPQVLQVL